MGQLSYSLSLAKIEFVTAIDPDDLRNEIHAGHDLESGLIARVRDWVDVLGWIRLGRVLRIAGSPSMLAVTTLTMVVHGIGRRFFLGASAGPSFGSNPEFLRDHFSNLISTALFFDPRSSGFLASLALVGWSILVWVPAVLMLTRQGALLTAGRTMVSLKVVLRHALSRSLAGYVVAWVPLVCVALVGLLPLAIGVVSGWLGRVWAIETMLGIIAATVVIPAAVLAFGAVVAVPMAWAAIASEADPDPLDALSRGYESLYRRPLQLALNSAAAVVAGAVVVLISVGVAAAGRSVVVTMLDLGGGTTATIAAATMVCRSIPVVVSFTVAWGLIGGVYLLVREATGGQEPEDLWQPSPDDPPTMPKLRR